MTRLLCLLPSRRGITISSAYWRPFVFSWNRDNLMDALFWTQLGIVRRDSC